MSLGDKHLVRQEFIPLGDPWAKERKKAQLEQEAKKKLGDEVYIQKNLKNWSLNLSVDEYGKVTCIARRGIGRFGRSDNLGDNAKIELAITTTEHRIPLVKIVGYDKYNPKFVEIDDRLDRTTESFKTEDEDYKREWNASSVLETKEFFSEIIPSVENMLNDKTLEEFVSSISDEAANVQKPFTRNYVKAKLEK